MCGQQRVLVIIPDGRAQPVGLSFVGGERQLLRVEQVLRLYEPGEGSDSVSAATETYQENLCARRVVPREGVAAHDAHDRAGSYRAAQQLAVGYCQSRRRREDIFLAICVVEPAASVASRSCSSASQRVSAL